MALTQGSALPDVQTTTTQATQAPTFYTNYLSDLAQAGSNAVNMDPSKMVAGFSELQQSGFGALPSATTAYKPYLAGAAGNVEQAGGMSAAGAAEPYLTSATTGSALGAAQPYLDRSTGRSVDDISSYMNPYTSRVVDEMARQSQQNLQRNILPGLKAAFVGSGNLGSQRYAGATGQTLADIQANLTGQQTGALKSGYDAAVAAAQADLNRQLQAGQTAGQLAGTDLARELQAGQTAGQLTSADMTNAIARAAEMRNLGTAESTLGLSGADALLKAGAQQQALEQARIEAPLKQATNAAALLRGYTIPTSTTQKYTGPMPGAYSASPLSQIAGLGSLFASGAGGTSAAGGVMDAVSKLIAKMQNPTADPSSYGATEVANTTTDPSDPGYGWKYYSDGTAIDPSGNYYYQGEQIWSPTPDMPQGADSWSEFSNDTSGNWWE